MKQVATSGRWAVVFLAVFVLGACTGDGNSLDLGSPSAPSPNSLSGDGGDAGLLDDVSDDASDDDSDDDAAGGVDVSGLVSGLTGTCPNLTFMVGATSVMTDATTDFDDGECADIVDGGEVEVEGVLNGSVLTATRVDLEDVGDDDSDDNGPSGPSGASADDDSSDDDSDDDGPSGPSGASGPSADDDSDDESDDDSDDDGPSGPSGASSDDDSSDDDSDDNDVVVS